MNPEAKKDETSRAAPVAREAIVAALFDLFRRQGYDGVSLADISTATGLGKSSLYHHFPDGKPDMAEAVCAFALDVMREEVFAPLAAEGPLGRKIAAMLATAEAMYEGGAAPCLVANMLPSGAAPASLRAIISEWIDAIAGALTAAGAGVGDARARAIDAVSAIEGSLIVAQAIGDPAVFAKTAKRLKESLSKP